MSAPDLNETHDATRRSWVHSANRPGCDFPLQNLPFAVFRRASAAETARVGVAIGDFVLDVSRVASLLDGSARRAAEACGASNLGDLADLGPASWSDLRSALFRLLDSDGSDAGSRVEPHLIPRSDAEYHRPFHIRAFTDFFASINHATNAGSLFRPNQPLLPNYKFVPIAYNGRTSSIRLSGAEVRRPLGQLKRADEAQPSRRVACELDYEAELGIFVGRPSQVGEPVAIADALRHVFGFCVLNDWSARDIQAWEYQPLGPYLAKSFATTISPWVVTEEALRPYRVGAYARPEGDPAPLPYLADGSDQAHGGLDIQLDVGLRSARMREADIAPLKMSTASSASLYWTVAQMLAHLTSNGCNLLAGELIGSGTISGPEPGTYGSLLEITRKGADPLSLPTGEVRGFLEDGDEVVITAFCEREGFARIGFGECAGTITPAPSPEH